jgi:hypothetical protein
VRVATLLALAEPADDATHLVCHGSDGYDTNIPFTEALKYVAELANAKVEYQKHAILIHGGGAATASTEAVGQQPVPPTQPAPVPQ